MKYSYKTVSTSHLRMVEENYRFGTAYQPASGRNI